MHVATACVLCRKAAAFTSWEPPGDHVTGYAVRLQKVHGGRRSQTNTHTHRVQQLGVCTGGAMDLHTDGRHLAHINL